MNTIKEKLEVLFGVSGADKFKKEFEQADKTVKKTSLSITSAMKSIGAAAVAYLSIQTVKALGSAVFSMSKLSDSMRVVQTSNERLSKSIGQSSANILAAVRRGVGGAVTDLEILKQVNQAILLGIPVTAKEMENMATVASRLGRAVGRDAASSLGDLVTGIGRMSPLILDNLGITIKLEEAYAKLGENATDAEKKIAFFNAVMEKAGGLSRTLGDQTISVGEKWDQVMTKIKNGSAVFGAFVTPAINIAIEKLSKLVDVAAKVPNAVAYLTTGSSDIAYSSGIDDPVRRTEVRIKELEDRLRGAIAEREQELRIIDSLGGMGGARAKRSMPPIMENIGFLGAAIAIQQDSLRRLRGEASISPYRSMGTFTPKINPAISERRSQQDIEFDAATNRMFESFNNGQTFDMEPQIRDMTKDMEAGFKKVSEVAQKDMEEIPISVERQFAEAFANISLGFSAVGVTGVSTFFGNAANLGAGLNGLSGGDSAPKWMNEKFLPALQMFGQAGQAFSGAVGLFQGIASLFGGTKVSGDLSGLSTEELQNIVNGDLGKYAKFQEIGDEAVSQFKGLASEELNNRGVRSGSNAYSVATTISETQANSIVAVLETQRAQQAEHINVSRQQLAVQTDMKFLMSINSGNLLTFAG